MQSQVHTHFSQYFHSLYLSLFSALFLISCSSNSSSDADDSSQPIDDPTKIQGSGNNDVLVWSEEFDVDGAPDSSTWNIQTGNGSGGWGNQEKQFYKAENIEVSNGTLKITAKKQSEGFQWFDEFKSGTRHLYQNRQFHQPQLPQWKNKLVPQLWHACQQGEDGYVDTQKICKYQE